MTPTLLAAAIAAEDALVPRPAGWMGTTEQWTQGLGIAFAVLNLVLLALAWRRLRNRPAMRGVVGLVSVALAILPVVIIFFGYSRGMAGMETVAACGGCHVMGPYVRDLTNPASESLAGVHFKNRYILEHHCYTCHSDYGMLGTVSAKMDGMRHVWHYVFGTYTTPLKIAHPYSNIRCLSCHGESQKFLTSPAHPPDARAQLFAGQVSCLDCHAPAHTPAEAKR